MGDGYDQSTFHELNYPQEINLGKGRTGNYGEYDQNIVYTYTVLLR